MKALVILHDGNDNRTKVLNAIRKQIIQIVVSLLGAKHVEGFFLSDEEVVQAILNKSCKKPNVEELKIDNVEKACKYVFHLYGGDAFTKPSEDIEKEMAYQILKVDSIHSANLKEACRIICNNEGVARVWFADNRVNNLFNNVVNVVKMTNALR